MATKIFVNLPVKDLDKSMAFFSHLGYTFNEQFTDNTAACMEISGDIFAMLLTHEKFSQFTSKQIVNATKTTEVLVCLSCDSKGGVNTLVDKALAAGATETKDPQDHGFMFGRSFNDLDGHIWEIMWMDASAINQPQTAEVVSVN
jgi:predicted lactoylglutathione lyase